MEKIKIKTIIPTSWRTEEGEFTYYTGSIEELNGSGIVRNIGFMFNMTTGDSISANDADNSLVCIFSDSRIRIEQVSVDMVVDVELHKTVNRADGIRFVTLKKQ